MLQRLRGGACFGGSISRRSRCSTVRQEVADGPTQAGALVSAAGQQLVANRTVTLPRLTTTDARGEVHLLVDERGQITAARFISGDDGLRAAHTRLTGVRRSVRVSGREAGTGHSPRRCRLQKGHRLHAASTPGYRRASRPAVIDEEKPGPPF